MSVSASGAKETEPPRLLDQLRHQIRLRHYSYRTEQAYVGWTRRFIRFHKLKHPAQMGAPRWRPTSRTWRPIEMLPPRHKARRCQP